ncbi:hypothetical protein [Salirhabdus salicampi]|uniref:hypothetical protein n=1 Tax=Salirhabdus salicampi TaxID=476102 RepID=UPI0020C541CB|nr:hypothetical protein [Salirhabdus salicampi]MCP8616126.1 hypothetical protein [Salirhabdus salicampi]
MKNDKYRDRKTNAPKEPFIAVQPAGSLSDEKKAYPGDSVEEHKALEAANEYLAEDEVKQQRNL